MQAAIGLLVSLVFLLAFTAQMPYTDHRTNILAIVAQSIQAFSYFSTILLKVDLNGEILSQTDIGVMMVGVNVRLLSFPVLTAGTVYLLQLRYYHIS
eukprot:COSAG02_NODE_4005_length_5922_cov_40.612227_3_plen_97_part_00